MKNFYTGAIIKGVKDKSKRIIWAKISDSVLDRDHEIIRLSAWKDKQLNEFLERSGALLLSHNYQSLPIGKILKFSKEPDGLYMEAQLVRGTESADEVWSVISQLGKIGFSVGFRSLGSQDIPVHGLEERERRSCLEAGFSLKDKIRVHTSCELWEVSLVSVPSLATATLISYKSGKLKNGDLRQACRDMEITIEPDEPDPLRTATLELQKIQDEINSFKASRIEAAISRALDKNSLQEATRKGVSEAITGLRTKLNEEPKDEEIEIDVEALDQKINKAMARALEKHFSPENLKAKIAEAIDLSICKVRGIVK